jgi:AraC-like DNA-binding protein
MRMIEAEYGDFFDSPVARYTVTGSSFVWCASPRLCGCLLWGQQSESETQSILQIFDQYDRHMGRTFDVIFDTRGVDRVDPRSLSALFSWLVSRREGLEHRIRLQASVIREGPIGFLLTGLLPVAGRTHPYRIFTDPEEAFRTIADDEGTSLCAEVEATAERIRGVPRELGLLRSLLAGRASTTLDEASRAVGMSSRSLQRMLTQHGTSFHREVTAARFALARELLGASDQKLAAISARVGISERSLTLLFRARTGLSPAEWRRKQRP